MTQEGPDQKFEFDFLNILRNGRRGNREGERENNWESRRRKGKEKCKGKGVEWSELKGKDTFIPSRKRLTKHLSKAE